MKTPGPKYEKEQKHRIEAVREVLEINGNEMKLREMIGSKDV